MMFSLPDPNVLYEALVARSDAYEGRAYVGVTSTGIFCRLNCPAPNPKPENCTFFENPGDCIAAGFRPCKRCHPLAPVARLDPLVDQMLKAFDADPMRRWSETCVGAMGFDPSTVRRAFKRHFGMTFLEMARHRRLRHSAEVLAKGDKVVEAQLSAGFESPSAFRAAFAKLMGRAPAEFAENALLRASWIDTPIGAMVTICDATQVHLLEFPERKGLAREVQQLFQYSKGQLGFGRFALTDQVQAQLAEFFEGRRPKFDLSLALHGTDFSKTVWRALQDIPAGQTRSYAQLAQSIARPTAMRAVARANGANQIAIVLPCHRVIGADGTLTGYAGGLWRKQKLIELERAYAEAPSSLNPRLASS
ncbi:trifunctional transcriptional activator/DNA repair protein Ada/methylated-DNA--[protein]-cysteine S-methyltransferase [Planktomarina temperata]|nr:trifunctional transcriptional activator/DNA repair protein Ada/methylated-DNA--[protein]-cysteine S-methyltransferase [Planktomarina temperata]